MISNEFVYFSVWVIVFFVTLILIDAVQNRLYIHIKRMPFCHAFFLPGVVFHELSHWVMCILMCRKVTSAKLYKFDHSTGTLGSVHFLSPLGAASWLPNMLIGMAPLFASAILFTIFLRSYGGSGDGDLSSLLNEWFSVLAMVLNGDVAWWIVLGVLSVSYSAIPSMADLKISQSGILLLYTLIFFLWRLDQEWIVTAALTFFQISFFRLVSVSIPSIGFILVLIVGKAILHKIKIWSRAIQHG